MSEYEKALTEEVERLTAIIAERDEIIPQANEMLRTIHENGLCQDWLNECGHDNQITWEQFLEEVRCQVDMDRWERSPDGISTLREALKEADSLVEISG